MKEYKALHEQYRKAVTASQTAELQKDRDVAKRDKARLMGDIRAVEREAARNGQLLSAVAGAGGEVRVDVRETETKRSLQEEYCRKFNDEAPVKIGGREQTLRQYHRRRLLGK